MKIAILGSAGFTGAALAQYFEDRGQEVFRLSRPQFDLTDRSTFNCIAQDTEVLIHAAGCVGEGWSEEALWKVNVESTYHLAQYVNTHCRMPLVIYLSSGAVYGIQSEDALTCASPLQPQGLYAVSKFLAEQTLGALLRTQLIRVRLFFPFGPGQRPPRLIPGLIQRIARGEAVELNTSEGRPFINPIFIDMLVRQISQIIKSPERHCYNLGGSRVCSIRQIAEVIGKELKVDVKFTIKERVTGNSKCQPDFLGSGEDSFEHQLASVIRAADYL